MTHFPGDYGFSAPSRCIACGKAELNCCDGTGTKDSDRYYYADMNPDYGARNEPRYRVFIHTAPGQSIMTPLRYNRRKAAERSAQKLNNKMGYRTVYVFVEN